jgi:RNA polymerase sigma-70 factor, ECF subfamily
VCTDCPRHLAGDLAGAFPDLVRHHQDLVYGLALRLVSRPSDAEDLAQDAFLRAYRTLERWPGERVAALRLRGWLAAIVLNLARDRARRRTRGGPLALSLEDRGGRGGGDALWGPRDVADDERERPEAVAAERETQREWQARLAALPPVLRRAVELRHVDGLSYPELAVALGRPVGTVKSDVHRGVTLLRERWLAEQATGHPTEEVAR